MKKAISENDIIKNLQDAGCDKCCIEHFMECFYKGDEKGELKTLEKHRENILDKLHEAQKEIDCIDYLVYQIERKV